MPGSARWAEYDTIYVGQIANALNLSLERWMDGLMSSELSHLLLPGTLAHMDKKDTSNLLGTLRRRG